METQKPNRWFVTLALLMVFGPIIWVSATFITLQRKGEALDVRCTGNIQQLSKAFEAYAVAHGGSLPAAAHWVDELQPYLQDKAALKCPAERGTARSSYAMNANLSGRRLSVLRRLKPAVLLYETKNPGDNPSGSEKDVVEIGRDTKGRHFRLANRYSYYLTTALKIERAGTRYQLDQLQWTAGSPRP
jgi:hypothetical protein